MGAVAFLSKQPPLVLVGAAALALGALYFVGKGAIKAAADTAAGLVSGNNAITEHQTNADGEKTTAYQGAGVLGTTGAVANSASGGVLASIGEWLGGTVYDMTHTDPNVTAPTPAYSTGGATGDW